MGEEKREMGKIFVKNMKVCSWTVRRFTHQVKDSATVSHTSKL